ncbi:MAG: A24 family peptidase C-terminal domain-containing protein [Candidatus Thermoplasmatota archaeon]|nr:A24 family peptidase C-terminal domain-containing protein [Candidatus Thermoplasmatota archaeon]
MPDPDLLRLAAGLAVLLYASYTDLKKREAANRLWVIMGGLGIVLLFFSDYDWGQVAMSIVLAVPLAFGLLFAGMGGADAKALLAIALLAPLFPHIQAGVELPLWTAPVALPFPFIVFINALLLFLAIPLAFLALNAMRGHLAFPASLLGYRMPASDVGDRFVWPMEKMRDGRRVRTILPQKDVDPAVFGDDEIWVTPKVPFLVPLTASYALSFILGDILYKTISLFI